MAMNRPPSRPPSGGQVGYQITDQVPATEADARGLATRGTRVYFLTQSGVRGSVFVSDDRYTPENVRAAVLQKAGVHEAVQQLTS